MRAAYREDQHTEILPLSRLREAQVDMATLIVVGNSRSYIYDGKLITPRGYAARYDLAGAADSLQE